MNLSIDKREFLKFLVTKDNASKVIYLIIKFFYKNVTKALNDMGNQDKQKLKLKKALEILVIVKLKIILSN